jgi:hypothetical protein
MLSLPSVETIFRDPRLTNLKRVSLTSIALAHIDDLLHYATTLQYISFCDCVGVRDAICILAGGVCGCENYQRIMGHAVRSPTGPCRALSIIEVAECDDLDFRCLKALVVSRNMVREEESGAESHALAGRKIKPLGRKSRSSAVRTPANVAIAPQLETASKPAKITYLELIECLGISESHAAELREMVDSVVWSETY